MEQLLANIIFFKKNITQHFGRIAKLLCKLLSNLGQKDHFYRNNS